MACQPNLAIKSYIPGGRERESIQHDGEKGVKGKRGKGGKGKGNKTNKQACTVQYTHNQDGNAYSNITISSCYCLDIGQPLFYWLAAARQSLLSGSPIGYG